MLKCRRESEEFDARKISHVRRCDKRDSAESADIENNPRNEEREKERGTSDVTRPASQRRANLIVRERAVVTIFLLVINISLCSAFRRLPVLPPLICRFSFTCRTSIPPVATTGKKRDRERRNNCGTQCVR